MIAALICGRLDEDGPFPGRNTFPLIERPMMAYPILAAQHSRYVQHVFVSTDAPSIARIARHYGVEVIERPPELSGPVAPLEDILEHGYRQITAALGEEPELLVLLLCNAPTVTSPQIDHGIEALRNDESLDAVMSVSRRNEFAPRYALQLDRDGLLAPHMTLDEAPNTEADVYFPDALLWVLNPARYFNAGREAVFPNWVVNCASQRVLPLIHDGYGDVDYAWQIPAIEGWLRRHGFSENATPYDQTRPAPGEATPAKTGASAVFRTPAERRVLITTVPFGEIDRRPLDLLEQHGIEYVINPINRKLKEEELAELAGDFGVLIAGTEPITASVMQRAPHLRLIARVGIGLDSVDLLVARQRGIQVTYTPDAPSAAVAELTVGMMIALLRSIPQADRGMRNGVWHRYSGRRLAEMTVGVIGVGRVGKRVIKHLVAGFGPRILANDLSPDLEFGQQNGVEWVEKEMIYTEGDIISLHVPLTLLTRRLITFRVLEMMKPDTMLINTSRGSIVDEAHLADALRSGLIGGAAVDVFDREPYSGELTTLERCLLTCHMGSMSDDSRARMEIEATEDVVRFLTGQPLQQPVPEQEYAQLEASR